MDLAKVLQQLREELNYLDAAILCFERLEGSRSRRGRPPAILSELSKSPVPAVKRSVKTKTIRPERA